MLHVLWLLGRTDLNATEGSSRRSTEHLRVMSHLFLPSIAHFSHLLKSAHRGALSVSWAEVLCGPLHVSARTHWARGSLPLSGKVSEQEWAFLCLGLYRPWAVSSTPWERRGGDPHVAFSTACVFSCACCSGPPAASSCSHQCSMTVLKDCFGLIVGTDYWSEISPRPPRKEDADHSPQKGFFVLLSQLPCSPLVVFPGSWKLLHLLSVSCLGCLFRCPSDGVALCNADCKQEA